MYTFERKDNYTYENDRLCYHTPTKDDSVAVDENGKVLVYVSPVYVGESSASLLRMAEVMDCVPVSGNHIYFDPQKKSFFRENYWNQNFPVRSDIYHVIESAFTGEISHISREMYNSMIRGDI
jgi:hypothetical protein